MYSIPGNHGCHNNHGGVEWGAVALNFIFLSRESSSGNVPSTQATALFQESELSQTDLMSDEIVGESQAMDDDKSLSCDDGDYNGLLYN